MPYTDPFARLYTDRKWAASNDPTNETGFGRCELRLGGRRKEILIAVFVVIRFYAIEDVVEFLQEDGELAVVLLLGDEVTQFFDTLFGFFV